MTNSPTSDAAGSYANEINFDKVGLLVLYAL